jgi:dephospho-CoA kinase
MVILGLTGSIGMGKSTAAAMLRRLGVPVCDSDALVHRLTGPGGAAVAAVERAFPGATSGGAVDRKALGARVFADPAALKRLEAILHPMVRAAQYRFLRFAAARRARVVVLDVPLLYESGTDVICDAVVTLTCPRFLQEQRVLARPGMSRARLAGVLARLLPDKATRRRADFVVQTGLGRRHSLQRLGHVVTVLKQRRGGKWSPSLPRH